MSDSPSLGTHHPYCGCLFFTSAALARVMNRIAEEAFAPTGLAPSAAFLVMTVNKSPGLSAGTAARTIALTPSTLTRLIEKLERQQLVERRGQGRQVRIYPTAKSVALDASVRQGWSAIYQRYVALLGEADSHELSARIASALERLEPAETSADTTEG